MGPGPFTLTGVYFHSSYVFKIGMETAGDLNSLVFPVFYNIYCAKDLDIKNKKEHDSRQS